MNGSGCEVFIRNPVNAGVPQGSILRPILFLLYFNEIPGDVIYNIAIYADDSTVLYKCDQASDLWQQLGLDRGRGQGQEVPS